MIQLSTKRLRLRSVAYADVEALAELNADPEVMRFFPAPLSRAESDAMLHRLMGHEREHGFSMLVVEDLEDTFLGIAGLMRPSFQAHFTPCIEIGWRFRRSAWGKGYATEAAHRVLGFGFGDLQLREVVSFTAAINERSIRVMERIGMRRDVQEDFDHPVLSKNDPRRRHVLYRLHSSEFSGDV